MMKEGFDKEIDSLLRRRARGAVKSFAGGDGAAADTSAHLDADELGSFAEGALPSPARLAAASHLADCDRCRGVAVELSRALGGGAELEQKAAAIPALTETKGPASWRAWAAALFSPRVLRFAAPVLALSLVAVVSYVALRTRNSGALNDARSARTQSNVSTAGTDAGNVATTGTANAAPPEGLIARNTEESSNDSKAPGAPPQPVSPGRGPSAGEPQPAPSDTNPGAATTTEDAPAPAPPPAASPEAPAEIAKAAPRPAVVEETDAPTKSESGRDKQKSAREAEPGDETASNDLAVQQQKRAAQNRANEVQMPDGGSRNQKRAADNSASNIYGGNAGASAAQPKTSEREDRSASPGAPRRARSNTRGERKADDDEAARVGDTREASGHRFRREGSAWVDVKYKSSMPSTGVRRGSEAFRALVADVPVIGRVAEQIGGEVVVVVSGRAYRIR